ncbi:RNA polymerase sigma factor [Planctomycetota bacterium]
MQRKKQDAKDNFAAADLNRSEEAFMGFYQTMKPKLSRYLLVCAREVSLAEELFQETFKRFIRKLRRGGDIDNPRKYLFTCARSVFLDYLRREGRSKQALSQGREKIFIRPLASGDSQRVSAEESTRLAAGVEALPLAQREVLVLRIFEDFSFEDIARHCREPYNTVVSRYRYAIEKLRRYMESFSNE